MDTVLLMHSILLLPLVLIVRMAAANKIHSTLSVTSLRVQPLAAPVAQGYFRLTRRVCSTSTSISQTGSGTSDTSNSGSSSGSSNRGSSGSDGNGGTTTRGSSPRSTALSSPATTAAAAACTGFSLSSTADFSRSTNSASFQPSNVPTVLRPGAAVQTVVGTVVLQNDGFMQPMDVGMPLITVHGSAKIKSQDGRSLAALPFAFVVSWSLGSPSPANMAGLFVLYTHGNSSSFESAAVGSTPLPGSKHIPLPNVKMTVQGFLPAARSAGSGVTVLGGWGQPAPASGVPGPRLFIKPGATRRVQLIAQVSTA